MPCESVLDTGRGDSVKSANFTVMSRENAATARTSTPVTPVVAGSVVLSLLVLVLLVLVIGPPGVG